jgi:hypothetical protein
MVNPEEREGSASTDGTAARHSIESVRQAERDSANAPVLKSALVAAARTGDATPTKRNAFGQMYEIRFVCAGPARSAEVLSVWIVRDDGAAPRLVTCYPV